MTSCGPSLTGYDCFDVRGGQGVPLAHAGQKSGVFPSDCGHIFLSQARGGMTSAHWPRSVDKIVARVLKGRRPSQVLDAVVRTITVSVGHLVGNRRARADKRFGYENVNAAGANAALAAEVDLHVSASVRKGQDLSGKGACSRRQALDATEARYRVVRRVSYDAPFLRGIILLNHDALHSRCGQGRAGAGTPVRPAYSTRDGRRAPAKSASRGGWG